MNPLRLLVALGTLLWVVAAAAAQTATLESDSTVLAPGGGAVRLTAVVTYARQPGAIGWSITLPQGWTLESLEGPDVPAVSPRPGAAALLEFAYTTVPQHRAGFSLVVRYPADARRGEVLATALVRTEGQLTTLKTTPVVLIHPGSIPAHPHSDQP